MKSNKLIVLIGVSLSGKSTWAKEYIKENKKTYIVSRDSERESLFGEYRQGDNKEEEMISLIVENKVKTMLTRGSVILDNTHLKVSYLNDIIKTYSGVNIEFKVFDCPELSDIMARNYKRESETGKFIPFDVLVKQKQQFESLKNNIPQNITISNGCKTDSRIGTRYNERPENAGLPWCIITDLDGTLSLMNGRNPFNGQDCNSDVINTPVYNLLRHIELLNTLKMTGLEISGDHVKTFIFSGRNSDNGGRLSTELWLQSNVGFLPLGENGENLIMRPEGDTRSDVAVKREMFKEHIEGKFRVMMVLDDRPQVIRLWKELGLDVFDVNPCSGEF